MIELAMELWSKYPWNLYADTARVAIKETPLLAFGVNAVVLDEAVALLDPRERHVVDLRYKQGLKFREIAEHLPNQQDSTKHVVNTRAQQLLGRAQRHLRESPLAGSFLFSGIAAGLEDEIARKEKLLAAANSRIDDLKKELHDVNPLYAKLHEIQDICRLMLSDCGFSTRMMTAMEHERNRSVCDVLAKASAYADSPDPLREYLLRVNSLGDKSISEVIAKFVSLGIYSPWPLFDCSPSASGLLHLGYSNKGVPS